MTRVDTARANNTRSRVRSTPHFTPISALSSDSLSLCGKLKRLCFNIRRSKGSSSSGSELTDYDTVGSEQYEDACGGDARISPDRPAFLGLGGCNCGATPVFTPSARVEPIVIDMNDFELIFDTPICEICKQGYRSYLSRVFLVTPVNILSNPSKYP